MVAKHIPREREVRIKIGDKTSPTEDFYMRVLLGVALLVAFMYSSLWAQQRPQMNAFIDPNTGVLKTVGYVDANAPGDIKIAVPDNVAMKPGEWKWENGKWVANPPPVDSSTLELQELAFSIDDAIRSPAVAPELKNVLLKLKKILAPQ
jgi:hypothetical protein